MKKSNLQEGGPGHLEFPHHTHQGPSEIVIIDDPVSSTSKMDGDITKAFLGAQAVMAELSRLMQADDHVLMQEKGRQLERALGTAHAAFVFGPLPRLLDVMAANAAAEEKRKARLRVLWINKLTLGLTFAQRRELRKLSAL